MIAYINGILEEIEPGFIVVESGGIGYGITVPTGSMPCLPRIGEMVKIYTHFHVNEDSQKLYGFSTKEEKELFKMLISVSGVGPKAGIGILSVLSPDDIRLAILSDDDKALSRAPGLGPKTARKIIVELKDKFSKSVVSPSKSVAPASVGAREEAISALISLGYSPSESLKAVSKIEIQQDMSAEDILRAALKTFA